MDNQSLATIDDLPLEIFELIVDQLKLKDKLKLPLVSKLWYTKFIHLKKITKLYISEESKNLIPNRFHLNRTEFNQHFFRINRHKFYLFFNLFKSIELSNLKDLRIFNLNKCPIKFISTLNSIKSLENLLICNINGLRGSIKISLPNLKSFTTDQLSIQKLSFHTPKLKSFKIDDDQSYYFSIHFKHPNSLEFIQINCYHIRCNKFLDYHEFPNLKKLVIRKLKLVGDNFLLNLNQLEELHIITSKDVFMNIYKQKLKLNLSNLKIYYYSLLIENLDNYNKWFKNLYLVSDTLTNNLASLYLNNYSKLSNEYILHDVIDYSSFEHLNLKVELWSKFINLRIFSINKPIKYEERFLELSKSKLMANIEDFSISIDLNSRILLDKLNLVIPFVRHIRVSAREFDLPVNNFKFLFKLKYLIEISVYSKLTKLDSMFLIELFQNLKYIKSLFLSSIKIHKLNNNTFMFYDLNLVKFSNINKLLEYLKVLNYIR